MGDVLSFRRKNADSPIRRLKRAPRGKRKKEPVNGASIKLWWVSQEFDDLVRKAVVDKQIPVEELAAVMAHRLGSLLVASDKTPELTLFCMKVISKITNQKSTDTSAS